MTEHEVIRYIDVKTLASMLAISTRTAYRLVSQGLLPQPTRFGRAARWNVQDVQAALKAQSQVKPPRRRRTSEGSEAPRTTA